MQISKMWMIAGTALSLSASAMAGSDDASRAYAAELVADSAARTSSLAQPAAFAPRVSGYLQFRYNINNRDVAVGEDTALGFQNARTVLEVQGNVGSDAWGYYVSGLWSDDSSQDGGLGGSSFTLRDAYVTYKLDNGWNIGWGQAKAPVLREELVGDTVQLAADRSNFNRAFSGGRTQGIIANYTGDSFRGWLAFTDGANTANTDFTGNEADYSLTARGEYKWAGDWKQSNDFTSFQGSPYFGMVGAAIHWQSGGSTFGPNAGSTSDTDLLLLTVDASAEGNGWNFFGAFAYRSLDPAAGSRLDDYGFLLQGGVFLAPQWELFGRFDMVFPDDNYTADNEFTTIAIGVNHYITPESHAAKLTIDWQYFFDQASDSALAVTSSTGGLLGSADDGEWNLRAQFQLVF